MLLTSKRHALRNLQNNSTAENRIYFFTHPKTRLKILKIYFWPPPSSNDKDGKISAAGEKFFGMLPSLSENKCNSSSPQAKNFGAILIVNMQE